MTINLSAGQGAGVAMVSGAAQLDPAGVFLAPIEDPTAPDAAGTGSTGADVRTRRTTSRILPGAAPTAVQDPPSPAGTDVGATTAVPTGLLTLPSQRLTTPTQRVDSVVVGVVPPGSTASVDIRGRDANGNWTEWIPSTDATGSTVTLPRTSIEVQSRLVLTGPATPIVGGVLPGPTVRGVTLIVHPIMLPAMPAPTSGPTTPASTSTTSPTTTSPTTTSPTTTDSSRPPTTPPVTSRPSTTAPSSSSSTSSRPTSSTTTTATTTTTRPTTTSPTTTSPTTTSPTTTSPTSTARPTTTTTTTSSSSTTSPAATPSASGTALRYRVFATREGLVGRTTANGHKIKSSDRFVALPSRRALSANGSHDYSVRVCAANGRCAIAPVWDVGPWNTRDDYWNPRSKRQEWRDLPQGMPESQAAKEKGYNGGKDQFGRKVVNPAGIDLSDGLFWDALKLKDNSWVTVDYLWTGSGSSRVATVQSEDEIRTAPDADAAVVGVAAEQSSVPVECVTGSGSDRWLRIGAEQYLPAKAVQDLGSAAPCATGAGAGTATGSG